jgi:tRNA-dihydrouridine synthase
MYTGEADWTLIGEAKKKINIPLIGNGDIKSMEEADTAFDKYGVDGVMIGRATFGQPWIFSKQAASLTNSEKIDILLELLQINLDFIGDEYKAILHTRRHLAATPVFKGIPDFRPTRIKMLRANTVKELKEVINEIKEKWIN